jgi:FixJ family two-component response regulator
MTINTKSRIIVVDDDKAVADTIALVLRHAGFQVSTFYEALPAAQHALESSPYAVVTDYSMPKMNGLALAAWLRDNCPGCKIVIVSGEAVPIEKESKGALNFTVLQKPVDVRVLIAAVQGAS